MANEVIISLRGGKKEFNQSSVLRFLQYLCWLLYFSRHVLRLVKTPKSPETQSVAVHAAQKRTVIDKAPWQHAGKAVTQGQFTDAQTDFVMPLVRVRIEVEPPPVGGDIACPS